MNKAQWLRASTRELVIAEYYSDESVLWSSQKNSRFNTMSRVECEEMRGRPGQDGTFGHGAQKEIRPQFVWRDVAKSPIGGRRRSTPRIHPI
jgi:hypothetical protein